jgi:B9 domain-containing protein 1
MYAGMITNLVWNFPLDVTFRATSVFGWPKLHFSVYGLNVFGMDVIQGYGFTHIPNTPGRCSPSVLACATDFRRCGSMRSMFQPCRYRLKVHLFKPKNRSVFLSLYSWFNNQPAEFKRPDFVCQSEGREGAQYGLCSLSRAAVRYACLACLPAVLLVLECGASRQINLL